MSVCCFALCKSLVLLLLLVFSNLNLTSHVTLFRLVLTQYIIETGRCSITCFKRASLERSALSESKDRDTGGSRGAMAPSKIFSSCCSKSLFLY